VTTLGIGLGVVHPGRGSGVLFRANLSGLSAGAVATLPGGLLFSRASSGHSVQTGSSSILIVGGFTSNDVARAGRRSDAHDVALAFEESRFNEVPDCRNMLAASWSVGGGSTTTAGQTGPDGAALAHRLQVPSATNSNFRASVTVAGTSYVCQIWQRAFTAPELYQLMVSKGDGTRGTATGTVQTVWGTAHLIFTAASTVANFAPSDGRDWTSFGGIVAGARDVVVDLTNIQPGKFPTSTIVTSGGSATRAGERLYYPAASDLFDAGRMNLHATLRPMGAAADYGAHMYLGRFDANNYVRVNNSTRRLEVVRAGVTVYNPPEALSFNAYDLLEVQCAAGGAGLQSFAKYRVNGGSWSNLTADVPAGAFSPSGAWDWLCAGTANQFTAWVYQLETLRAGVVLS
jgi:hypothetical protein